MKIIDDKFIMIAYLSFISNEIHLIDYRFSIIERCTHLHTVVYKSIETLLSMLTNFG